MSLVRYLKVLVGAFVILLFGGFIAYMFYSSDLSENAKMKESYASMQSTVDFDAIKGGLWIVGKFQTTKFFLYIIKNYCLITVHLII